MSDLINKKEALNLLRKRSQQLVGIYGDLGGAVSGAARLIDELPSADRPTRVYEYLRERIGDTVDSETEFEAWFERMVWHVEECNRLADRPQDDEFKNFDRESLILLIEAQKERIGELLADRPQGEWTQSVFRSDIYRYECSNCKAHHRARYDFCPSCGASMKGADDESVHSQKANQ